MTSDGVVVKAVETLKMEARRLKLALVIPTPEVQANIPVALLTGSFTQRLEKAVQLGYDGVELMALRPAESRSP